MVTAAIMGVLAGSQVVFHLLFTLIPHAAAGGSSVRLDFDYSQMVVFHLVAALLSAVVLARGEAALCALLSAVRAVIRVVLRPVPVELAPTWTCRPRSSVRSIGDQLVVLLALRRGPPQCGGTALTV